MPDTLDQSAQEKADAFVGQQHLLFVDGAFVPSESREHICVENPATGSKICSIARANAADVDRAVSAAQRAFDSGAWSKTTPTDRQSFLLKLADALEDDREVMARIETIDNGKPLSEALIDVDGTVRFFRYMAGWATKIGGRTPNHSAGSQVFGYTQKRPIGPVGAITPWNFPLSMAGWKLAAPLAAGCSIVLKPSELTSLSTLRLANLIDAVGFPPGAVNIVTGYGAEAGAALIEHDGIAKLAFTGSTNTGQMVAHAAAQQVKPSTLELGGKSPMVVFDDCDPAEIAHGLASAIFFNQGQVCTAGSRLYVQRAIYDDVVQHVATIADEIQLGCGLATTTAMGPLISSQHHQRVSSYIQKGDASSARRVTSNLDNPGTKGHFIRPVVYADVDPNAAIAREEIFGPVLSCAAFDTEEEAIALANDSKFGLAASVWTNDLHRAHKTLNQLEAGILWANTHNPIDPSLPFGGVKLSGYGREMGPEQLDSYLTTHSVWIQMRGAVG